MAWRSVAARLGISLSFASRPRSNAPLEVGGAPQELPTQRLSALTVWVPPVLVTWALCFYRIGSSQMWQDENSTWWATQLPRPDFFRLLGRVDTVLAPYYALMRAWTSCFGD